MKRFVVDNRSDPEAVREAVTDLKRLIRLGKHAEKALQKIRSEGHYDGRVATVGCSCPGGYLSASIHRFPAYVPVFRDMIPGWENLAIWCGEVGVDSHGGTKFPTISVHLSGNGFSMNSEKPGFTFPVQFDAIPKGQSRIGFLRLKKNGDVTFTPVHGYASPVIRVWRNPELSKTRAAMAEFARIVAKKLVHGGEPYEQSRINVPQWMIDLNREAAGWMVEDGIVKRMFNDMLDAALVVKVIEA